jgi:beta-glucosidase
VWGAGTSACQIEGSPLSDGASETIQHRYAHTPGMVPDGQTDDVTADHYRRYREDCAIMGSLGLGAYQFSVSWARVLPEGMGRVNQKGLDFYDSLVDELVANGVAPAPVLYVWDLPGVLQDRGGWANRDCVEWFADYAAVVFDRLGDRATLWLTIIEPWSIAHAGNIAGMGAPSIKDIYTGARVLHHLMLGHGRAVQAFRASDAIGLIGSPSTPVMDVQPATESAADVAAAERVRSYVLGAYLDPFMLGTYPPDVVEMFGEAWPEVRDGDLTIISEPVDYLGVTYYMGFAVADGPSDRADGPVRRDWILGPMARLLDAHVEWDPGPPPKGSWEYHPAGIENLLVWLSERYDRPPIYVTENGVPLSDTVSDDGRVDDPERIEYLTDHFAAGHRAIERGVDLRGWFVWSMIDTWEFGAGFRQRYGLVYVDYETQRRIVKSSGYWYRDVMAANGFDRETVIPPSRGGAASLSPRPGPAAAGQSSPPPAPPRGSTRRNRSR